jgi:putative hydrolase of the HAD superfamily
VTLRGAPVELVFFDVGDTLMRPDPSWAEIYLRVCRAHGIDASPEALGTALREALAGEAWNTEGPFEATAEASWARILVFDRAVMAALGHRDVPESFFRALEAAFAARDAWHVFPDVVPSLEALAAAGVRRAVISNWLWGAPDLLHALELASRFEELVISARVGYQKPNPGIFRHALEVTGVAPEAALHVGDSYAADVVGASGVGISPVLIDRDGRIEGSAVSEPGGPRAPVVRDLYGLLDLLGVPRPLAALG